MKRLIVVLSISLFSISAYSQTETTQPAVVTSVTTATLEQRDGYYLVYPGQVPTFQYEFVKIFELTGVYNNLRASNMIYGMVSKIKHSPEKDKGNCIMFTDVDMFKAMLVKVK